MRKPLGLNADGSVTVPAEMVRDLVGAARELILEQRDSCIILSPLKVSLQGGNLPKLLAAYHEPESIDTVLEKRFKRSGEGKAQFQGDLEVLALNDVIMFISASRKSGALLMDVEPQRALFFQGGNIISALAAGVEHSFAAFLLRRHQITESDLGAGLDVDRADPCAGLKQAAHIPPTEWDEARGLWMEGTVFGAFHEQSGAFRFIDGELDRALHIGTEYTATNFVMEGMRRIDEMARVKDQLPPPGALLAISKDISISVKLTAAEESLLAKVNGKRTVEEALLAAGLDEVDGAKSLFTLISTGIVHVATPAAPAPAPAPAAPGGPPPLGADEARRYVEITSAFNDVFSAAYHALHVESGDRALIALNAFFKQNQLPLFNGVQFAHDGTLSEAALLVNLQQVEPDVRRDVLIQELNEVLYFTLYALKTGVNAEVEHGIVEMAHAVLKPLQNN